MMIKEAAISCLFYCTVVADEGGEKGQDVQIACFL